MPTEYCKKEKKEKNRKNGITAFIAASVAAMLVLLSGCGVKTVYVSPEKPFDPSEQTAAEEQKNGQGTENSTVTGQTDSNSGTDSAVQVFFTAEDTRAMSNTMLASTFTHDGKTLYGSKHDENGIPYLCRMKYSAVKDGMVVRETEILETGVSARYLIFSDGVLYYLRTDMETGNTSIVALRTDSAAKTDSTATSENTPLAAGTAVPENAVPETLYSGTCDYLFLHGDRLYFTDGDNHLLSLSLADRSISQVAADREIFIPYLISDDLLLYQDDGDGESLHLRDLATGTDRQIAEGRVYEYVLSGSTLYFSYVEESTGTKSRLSRLNINDAIAGKAIEPERADGFMGTRFCINGDHLNGSNWKTVPLSSWNTLSDNQYEKGFLAACQYVADSFEIFYNYNSDGLIEKAVFYEPAEKRASYFELK